MADMGVGLGALAIILTVGLPVLFFGMVFGFILLLVRMLSGGKGANAAMTKEEARQFQEIHNGLERMAQRVEALETILLDKQPKEEANR